MAEEPVFRHRLRGEEHLAAAGEIGENVFHLRLEVEPVGDDEIGPRHRENVGAGLAIGVGVDTRPHQRPDLDRVAAHLANGIGEHARRRHHLQRGGSAQRMGQQRRGGPCNEDVTTRYSLASGGDADGHDLGSPLLFRSADRRLFGMIMRMVLRKSRFLRAILNQIPSCGAATPLTPGGRGSLIATASVRAKVR